MRLSRYFLPVLRDVPKEAEIVSHRLMLRAGMIRQQASGLYSWLPMGYKVLMKVQKIIEEEQNRSGAIELGERRRPVADDGGFEPLLSQQKGKGICQRLFVFDDQHVGHCSSPVAEVRVTVVLLLTTRGRLLRNTQESAE